MDKPIDGVSEAYNGTSKATSRNNGLKIVVIGGGVGGLAVASLLALDGHRVKVIEKNENVGGRASALIQDGFYFSRGPAWYLMPEVYDNFFNKFQKKTSDFYHLYKLDPSYRIFFDDGDVVDIRSDVEKNYQLFDSLEKDGGEKLRKYLAKHEAMYRSIKKILYLDLDSMKSIFNREIISVGIRINIFESVEDEVKRIFKSDKARKILLHTIGFFGTPPSKSPSFYGILNYVKMVQGVYYPQGGFRRVVDALYDIGRGLGIEFILGCEVKKIEVVGNMARRVIADNIAIEADVVVVDADYAFTEMNLLDPKYCTYDAHYWSKKMFTPSALMAYIGLKDKVDSLVSHNVVLERDWSESFNQIFDPRYARWPEYASYYVHVPSKIDASAAYPGCESVYLLIPVASGLMDKDLERERLLTNILIDLERKTGEGIRDKIIFRKLFSIRDFSSRYNSYKGSALGLAYTLFQTAFWRPRHRSMKVKNLYYTGHYTHPGIGVPMALISAEIVREKIAREMR